MTKTIQREICLPQPREKVWLAISNSASLADWMYPNDFEPHVGHRFTFRVPPKPEVGFDGLTVNCEVIECEPPCRLMFSWAAGGLANSQVSFRLEPDGEGTRLFFEHSGFDVSQTWGNQAFQGAQYGWAKMLQKLAETVVDSATNSR